MFPKNLPHIFVDLDPAGFLVLIKLGNEYVLWETVDPFKNPKYMSFYHIRHAEILAIIFEIDTAMYQKNDYVPILDT